MLHTVRCHGAAGECGVIYATVAGVIAVHEADSEDEAADVPGRGPVLLVVVGEGGADGRVDLEATVGSVEIQFGGMEGIVLVEFEQAVVHSLREIALHLVETEVEVVGTLPRYHHPCNRVCLQTVLLLPQSGQLHPFSLHDIGLYSVMPCVRTDTIG